MEAFKELYDVIVRLRSPGGCSWDREQTPRSLRGDLIEETYECIEAIDQQEPNHIKEELGDIFLLVTMIAYMHEQEGLFSVADVLKANAEKLIRRHPHVFEESGKGTVLSPEETLEKWAQIKIEKEGRKPKDSILDEVRRGLPPLDRAWKLQKKAAKAGFDWPDTAGVIGKIKEELEEVEEAAAANAGQPADAALEGELGDLLFSVVNLCRFFDIEPSVALQRTNTKFTERFSYVEKRMKESGQEMNAKNLAVMDQYWNMAK
ncbi:MAG: nucleoside triphosphate pyrophosphohydrolase [Treponema sp.]|nr:nucleoside triphosphate pyrophosphohydrolase [Treponema sp.]